MTKENNRNLIHYRKVIGKLGTLYHEIAMHQGFSDSAHAILYTICFSGKDRCPIHDICLYSGISKQTINSSLRKLEKDGVVYLRNVDGRSKEVVLTEKGKEICSRTVCQLLDAEDSLLQKWSNEDLAKYIELSERFLSDITRCYGDIL